MDYCNHLLYKISDGDEKRLRRLHYQAARLITRTKRSEHMTPVLKSLHWLPIEHRSSFKILCTVYKTLNGAGPGYLAELLTPYEPSRTLRSTSESLLCIPKTNLGIGYKAFSYAAPSLWNPLPDFIKNSKSLSCFKTSLKTFYFRKAYC